MKRVLGILLLAAVALASCSKKTRPTTSVPPKKPQPSVTVLAPPVSDSVAPVTAPPAETEPAPPAAAGMAPMVVIDDKGRIVTSKEKLPEDIASKVNYSKITRGYTPVQRQNLIYRFKMIPPRVLFVPDQYASKSAKGTYVVYKKKFWYWKKDDGLFHIDETYYQ